jgi:hypothetical protein
MATQYYHIRLCRGLKANLPASGEIGEPFYATDTGELFIGQGSGHPLAQIIGSLPSLSTCDLDDGTFTGSTETTITFP